MNADEAKNILLVEDNRADARLIEVLLAEVRDFKFRLRWVDRITKAQSRLAEERIDIVMLDLSLPDSQGLDTLVTLKSAARHIPIVVLTSFDDQATALEAVKLGAQDYLLKGQIDGELLVRAIHYAIERMQLLDSLNQDRRRYQMAVRAGGVGVWDLDLTSEEMYIDPHLKALLGYTDNEIANRLASWGQLIHPPDRELVNRELEMHLSGESQEFEVEHRMLHKDGSLRWFLAKGNLVCDQNGEAVRLVGTDTDITTRKELEFQLRFMATHDALTGLANRTLFFDRMEHALAHASRYYHPLYVLVMDLDGFKQVNDVFGHPAGDEALRELGRRIASSLRNSDTVARVGGDEFALLLEDLKSTEQCSVVAEKVLASIQQPLQVEGQEIHLNASIGIACFPTDGQESRALLKAGDEALYQAKARRGTYVYYRKNGVDHA